jgi:hypothetical protein
LESSIWSGKCYATCGPSPSCTGSKRCLGLATFSR